MKIHGRSRWLVACLTATLLQGCSGGNDSPAPPPPPAAPSNLAYAAPPAFTVNTAIAVLTPTVTGTVTSYSVAPALPAGLQINGATGAISGAATALQAATNYQVTASNSAGSTTATLSITVNDVPPDISYPAGAKTFTSGVPVTLTATATGGPITSWSVLPALPTGLTFNTSTGAIGGTPTATSAARDYLVAAQNTGGTDTFTLNITVQSGVLLDVGHRGALIDIQRDSTRMMTFDQDHRGVLWTLDTRTMLASTDACTTRCIALAGPTAVFQTTAGFEIRNSVDGALLGQVPAAPANGSWWVLASDGSYVCTGSATSVTCWSRQGTQLFTRAGDYRNGIAVASADTLRIARGAAGNNVIEKLAIPSGASTTTPAFATSFVAWFGDGQRFLASAGNTAVVYSNDAVQQESVVLPTVDGLAGNGNWYWTASGTALRIYALGSGGTPAATYTLAAFSSIHPGLNSLAILERFTSHFSIVDLSGATPGKVDWISSIVEPIRFDATSATEWSLGNEHGVVDAVYNGLENIYARGAVRSIAGTATRSAVSTSSGRVLVFNSQTLALEYEFTALSAAKLELSDDGTRLAAGPDSSALEFAGDRSVRLYDLPGQTLLKQWTYDTGGPEVATDFTLSGSGLAIGQVAGPLGGLLQQKVTQVDDAPIFSQASTGQPIRLNSNAGRIAISTQGPGNGTGTQVFVNGALTTTAAGWAVDWLDDTRLLLNRYRAPNPVAGDFEGALIVDSAGTVLGTPALPELRQVQPLTANSLYSPELNLILEISTGNTLWSSVTESGRHGAVAGSRVLFDAGATVRAEPRQ